MNILWKILIFDKKPLEKKNENAEFLTQKF